jgi:hypothetical protein
MNPDRGMTDRIKFNRLHTQAFTFRGVDKKLLDLFVEGKLFGC